MSEAVRLPVICHLGAVVNFVAGSVSRAPAWMQPAGLGFLKMFLMRILPYAVWLRFSKIPNSGAPGIEILNGPSGISVSLSNTLCSGNLDALRVAFRQAAAASENVILNLGRVDYIDSAFLGLVVMLQKHVQLGGHTIRLTAVPQNLRKIFYWCGMEYLLAEAC